MDIFTYNQGKAQSTFYGTLMIHISDTLFAVLSTAGAYPNNAHVAMPSASLVALKTMIHQRRQQQPHLKTGKV
jgi:hypothetical protein